MKKLLVLIVLVIITLLLIYFIAPMNVRVINNDADRCHKSLVKYGIICE